MKQHPDLSTLMSYSSGTLSLAFSTLVTSHIETCDHCKEIVQIGNELGASMMENDIENKDKTEDFNVFLNKLNNKNNKSEAKEIEFDLNSEVPASLQRYIGTDLDQIQWSFFAPGIQKKPS
jgi:putative transcriptional regulator